MAPLARTLLACLLGAAACGDAEPASRSSAPAETVGDAPLAGGLASPVAVGEAVVAGLNAGDPAALAAVVVTEADFKGRLFAALSNGPKAGNAPDIAWQIQQAESRDDMLRALAQHGRKDLRFIRLEPRGVVRRAGLVIHQRPRLVVADAEGRERSLPILASVIEHEPTGTCKLLGYRDHD